MDKYVELVCMNLTSLPNGETIHSSVIDEAIREVKERLNNGEVIGCVEGSDNIARLHVLSIYRSGPFVYCRARILEENAPSLSYGLSCGGTIQRVRESITKFSFVSVSAVIHPAEPLTK